MRKRVHGMIGIACVILLQLSCMIIPASARTDFLPAWPLRSGFNIISLDYYQDGDPHTGIDIGHGNQPTQDVYAVADGTVVSAKNLCAHYNGYPHNKKSCKAGNLGNFVKIRHNVNGKVFYSQYGHLTQNSITVKVGQKVTAGTKIGKMGSSGNSMGPHLHLAIFQGDYTAKKGQKTFDFYMDNPDVMKGITIAQGLVKPSKNYGTWIKENGTLNKAGTRYTFTNLGTQTTPKPNDPSTLAINLTNYPGTIKEGDTFSLRGEVSSNYKITSVKGYVINASNKTVQSTEDKPNSTSMDIRSANLNQRMLFDKLSPGAYTLKIEAKDASGKIIPESKSFTVTAKGQENAPQNTPPDKVASTLNINLTNYPTSIKEGDMFSLRGEITSNYNITNVNGYIINLSNNKTLQTTTDTPNAKSMDIRPAELNQSMLFDKLSPGSYYLRIEATDASDKTLVSSKSFTVNAKNSASSPSKGPSSAPKMAYPNPGWYALTPACAPGMRLDVAYGGASSEDPVWIWEANSTPAQSWYLLPYSMTVGHYILISGTNMQTRMVLDVQYGGTESGTPVWLYESNDTPAQEWIFLDAGGGYYYIVPSENQNLTLAVEDGSSEEGSSLVVETRNGSAGQKWTLISG